MSKPKPPEKQDLTLMACNGIKTLMFKNEISPDLRLNARSLAKQLDMSPTPVVQALKLLHFQGIIGHIPNRGYFIETNTPQMVQDIFNLRLALETESLNSLLSRITPGGWQELEKAAADHIQALEKNLPKQVLLADMAFHITLARIATGTAGERLMRNLFEMLYLKNRSAVLYISPRKAFGFHHTQILEALHRQEVPRAQTILRDHIQTVKEALITNMEKEDSEQDANWHL